MGMKCEGDTITCDCGFSFQRGQSGKHECADGLRSKLAAAVRREESLKASVDVMGHRIAELLAVREAQSVPVAWQQNWAGNDWQDCSKEMFKYLTTHLDPIVQIRALYAAPPAPAVPDEIKQVLLWALWHHLGGCSSIGQPIRKFLGMGANERMTDEQLITAKAYPASVAEKRVIFDSWIACSERMPPDETTVQVRNEKGVVWIADVDHGGQFYPDEFPVAKMSHGEITHWMPIPAAPTK